MLRKLRPHLSFANVTSLLALFVALGGTSAYAINEWNGSNIQDESLTGADIKGKPSPGFVDGSLDTYDIRNKSLLSSDVAANTLTAGELGPNSVSTSELKDGAVTNSKIGSSVVDSSKVQDHSLTTADLDGTDHSGAIAVGAITNGRCATITGSVSGARPGDAVVVTTNGAIPSGVLIYGQRARTDAVDIKVCNLSGATSSAISDLPIRVLTIH